MHLSCNFRQKPSQASSNAFLHLGVGAHHGSDFFPVTVEEIPVTGVITGSSSPSKVTPSIFFHVAPSIVLSPIVLNLARSPSFNWNKLYLPT